MLESLGTLAKHQVTLVSITEQLDPFVPRPHSETGLANRGSMCS